jgi:Ca-activated chloride channel family protein
VRRSALLLATASICAAFVLFGPQAAGHALLALGFPSAAARVFDDAAWKAASLSAAGRWNEAAAVFATNAASAYNLGHALARAGRYEEAIAAFDGALAADAGDVDAAFNKALLEAALRHDENTPHGGGDAIVANSPAAKAGGSRERPPTDGRTGGAGEGLASGRQTEWKAGVAGGGKATKAGAGGGEPSDDGAAAANGAAGASEGAGRPGDLQTLVAELLREREQRARRRLQAGAVHPSLEWLQTLPDDPGQFLKLRILAEKARRLRAAGGPIPEDD